MATENLAVKITGNGGDLSRAFSKAGNDAERAGKRSRGAWKAAGKGIGLAAGGIAVAIVGIGLASTKAAADEQKAQALLKKALKNTTGATDKQVDSVEKWITAQQNASGIMDDELRPALSTLLRATGDQTKAQDLLKVSMDVATATGKPLQAVTIALGKAYGGNVGGLAKMGIQTKDAAGKTLEFKDVLVQLKDKMGGATAAAADTLSGKMAIAKAKFEDVKEAIGMKLIPILSVLATVVTSYVIPAIGKAASWLQDKFGGAVKWVVAWVKEHWPEMKRIIVDAFDKVVEAGRKVVEKIQSLIGWFRKHDDVTRALATAIGIVLVGAMAKYVVSAGIAAIATAAATWPVLLAVAAIAGVILVLDRAGVTWPRVWRGMKKSYDALAIPEAIREVKRAIESVQTSLNSLHWAWGPIWAGMKSVAHDVIGGITGALRELERGIQRVIDLWNVLTPNADWGGRGEERLPGAAPGQPPGGPLGQPDAGAFPQRARGGPVGPFRTYLTGERGPELLTMGASGGMVHPNAGGTTVILNVSGILVGGKAELERVLTDALVSYERKNGRRYLGVVNP